MRVAEFNSSRHHVLPISVVVGCGIGGIKWDLLDQDAAGLSKIQMDWGIARVMSFTPLSEKRKI